MTSEDAPDTANEQHDPGFESDIQTLWVSSGRNVYHTDRDCTRFKSTLYTRRAEIAKAWYDPCSYCATGADDGE